MKITYTTYCGKVRLEQEPDGRFKLTAYERDLERSFHQMKEVFVRHFPADKPAMARKHLLMTYSILLDFTKEWAQDEFRKVNHGSPDNTDASPTRRSPFRNAGPET